MKRFFFSLSLSLSLVTLLLFSSSTLFAEKMRIAVMDFKADGISSSDARRISELIRGGNDKCR